MSVQCQWHDKHMNGCNNTATWIVWLKKNGKVKVYLCDDHTKTVADYHTKNGAIDSVDGRRIHDEENQQWP